MKRVYKIYGGVCLSEDGKLQFNWKSDEGNDILSLVTDTSGEAASDPLKVIYGYKFNSCSNTDKKIVRDALKHPSHKMVFSEDIEHFVETGVLRLDRYFSLDKFQVKIRIKSTSSEYTLLDVMDSYLCEYCNKIEFDFRLIKQMYEDVSFDADKALQAMLDAGYNESTALKKIEYNTAKFDELKTQGKLFEMKRFIPKAIRAGFYNFLKFSNDDERKLYMTLQGVDVLLYDDFLTSGATVSEAARYLHSINPSNNIIVFVLVNQN